MLKWESRCTKCDLAYSGTGMANLRAAEALLDDHSRSEHSSRRFCGERRKYVMEHCRCLRCREANSTYMRKNNFARNKGMVDLHDATEARNHLKWLVTQGVGTREVVRRAGLGRTAIVSIKHGATARIRWENHVAILAIRDTNKAGGALVDATQVWQEVGELVALGYPKAWISRQLGGGPALQISKKRCTRRTADAMHRLRASVGNLRYDERADLTRQRRQCP